MSEKFEKKVNHDLIRIDFISVSNLHLTDLVILRDKLFVFTGIAVEYRLSVIYFRVSFIFSSIEDPDDEDIVSSSSVLLRALTRIFPLNCSGLGRLFSSENTGRLYN